MLLGVCLVSAQISAAVIDWSVPELLRPPLYLVAVFFSNWIFATVMLPSLLVLTLSIPRPRGPLTPLAAPLDCRHLWDQYQRSWRSLARKHSSAGSPSWSYVCSALGILAQAFVAVRDPAAGHRCAGPQVAWVRWVSFSRST